MFIRLPLHRLPVSRKRFRPGAILSYHNMHTEHKKNNSIRQRRNKHERT